MIAVYGLNGDGESALKVFEMLKSLGLGLRNAITFKNILSASSHSKLIAKVLDIFRRMAKSHSIEPTMDHYACVVSMLAKSGKIDVIEVIPLPPGAGVWSSLLVGCGMYTHVGVAETAGKWLSVLDPRGNAWRVTLSNVYASAGRWGDVAKVREEMKDSSVPKAGCSTVLVQRDTFDFFMNDMRHPESGTVFEALETLMKQGCL